MYYEGWGVPKDRLGAIKHYYYAAQAGISEAQYNLGSLYFAGDWVPKNLAQAYRWFSLAAEQGDEAAKVGLEAVEGQISEFDLAEGRRLLKASRPPAVVSAK
jgi:TPR repeat protein